MEINKQLFEDILSGKLKGTFVLRNGETYFSDGLCRNYSKLKFTHPYVVGFKSYTPKGIFDFNMHDKGAFDIIDFIPNTNMKENELTIEIPDGKMVDWKESEKQNKIVLKDKQLTYEDVCKKLFNGETYYINTSGKICSSNIIKYVTDPNSVQYITDPNNATTEHQLECILAKNKLANVAKYLNDGWKPNKGDFVFFLTLWEYLSVGMYHFENYGNQIIFKNREVAQQAVEILGEETVKLALESLGV